MHEGNFDEWVGGGGGGGGGGGVGGGGGWGGGVGGGGGALSHEQKPSIRLTTTRRVSSIIFSYCLELRKPALLLIKPPMTLLRSLLTA